MFDKTKIRNIWRENQDQIIDTCADVATVYFPITVSGTASDSIDNLFGESLDANEPYTVGSGVQTQTDSVTISGIFRSDLYGSSVSYNEAFQEMASGKFDPEDALFTCKLSDAQRNTESSQFYTYFHGCSYVTIANRPDEYQVRHVAERGLMGAYVADVWLRRKNQV